MTLWDIHWLKELDDEGFIDDSRSPNPIGASCNTFREVHRGELAAGFRSVQPTNEPELFLLSDSVIKVLISMKKILIVFHSKTGGTYQMAQAAASGAA